MPRARRPLVWSICRIAFFFTMPNSSSMPSAENTLMVWPVTSSDRMPNGIASGKRQQNRERMDEGFKLRRQHDVHKDERERERQAEIVDRCGPVPCPCR